MHEKFENTKIEIRSRKSKKGRQYNDQKKNDKKQWSTKHYTENETLSDTNPTKNRVWTQVLRKGRQFLLH